MSEVFNNKPAKGHKINRNPFDLSFQTNGTFRFGRLYPVFVKNVIAGEGLTIKPSLGLRSLPMAFPTQTRCKVYMHFWYVRNRNLWRNWTDWLAMADDARSSQGGVKKNYEFPWVALTDNQCKTGSLADWLGLPTTFASTNHMTQVMRSYANYGDTERGNRNGVVTSNLGSSVPIDLTPLEITSRMSNVTLSKDWGKYDGGNWSNYNGVYIKGKLSGTLGLNSTFVIKTIGLSDGTHQLNVSVYKDGKMVSTHQFPTASVASNVATISLTASTIKTINSYFAETNGDIRFAVSSPDFSPYGTLCTDASFASCESLSVTDVNAASVEDAVDAGITPFSGSTPAIKISALPFRAYESIYNAFYRNTQVNPASLKDSDNGTSYYEYNKFCCDYDGKDTNGYDFYNKNWEQDQFTTMHCSPQLGDAPLVSLSSDASDPAHFVLNVKGVNPIVQGGTSSTSSQKNFEFTPIWKDDDPNTNIIEGFTTTSNDVPTDLKSIMKVARCGITINDLRNASALQRYLEARIRASYSYRDIMQDVYHIEDLDYNNVAFPEFLGGTSDEISINCINNTNADAAGGLGDYGANATCLSDNNRSINVFCPEHGYVIGLLCIEPVATYSQLLRKDLLVPASPLDIYTEHMANIGLQPIRAKELTPIQRASEIASDPNKSQDEIIGYQRPWYEYIRKNDEIHGSMRKDLAGYVITRIFDKTPHLNAQFVECRANDITTPFYDGSIDGFLGMVYFNVGAKLPIPLTDSVHLL